MLLLCPNGHVSAGRSRSLSGVPDRGRVEQSLDGGVQHPRVTTDRFRDYPAARTEYPLGFVQCGETVGAVDQVV
jgi:hypothetical protein